MIPFDITIEVVVKDILKTLEKVKEPINISIPETVDEIADLVRTSVYQNFIEGGRPSWPLRKYTYSHPMLMKSLAMMELAQATAGYWFHEGRDHHIDIESTEYAIYQHDGTDRIDSRPFAEITEEEEVEIETKLADSIEELFFD